MKELLPHLIDPRKLPYRLLLAAAAICGFLTLAPEALLARWRLLEVVKAYGPYISLTFLVSSVLAVFNGLAWVVQAWATSRRNKKWLAELPKRMAALDHAEKGVLREFMIKGTHLLDLPVDHPTVVGLLRKGILRRQGPIGTQMPFGILYACDVAPEAESYLNRQFLGIPPGQLTEHQKQELMNQRPEFLRAVDNYAYLFNR